MRMIVSTRGNIAKLIVEIVTLAPLVLHPLQLPPDRVVTEWTRRMLLLVADRFDRVCFLGILGTILPVRATRTSASVLITQKPGFNIDYKLSRNASTTYCTFLNSSRIFNLLSIII